MELKPIFEAFHHVGLLSAAVDYAFNYDAFSKTDITAKRLLQNMKDVVDKKWCAYTFVMMLDLRVCPYCNEQYIAPTVTKGGKVRGDIDHFLPKSKYPYFALSIYNMISCCKFCNSSLKGTKYFENPKTATPYEISYNDCFDFVADMDNQSIEIVEDKTNGVHVKEILDVFIIRDRYQHHTDILNDYLNKKMQYSCRLMENIKRAYPEKSISAFLSDYFGYPLKKEDIGKNVLDKLKRDIAKGLLKHPLY